MATPRNIAVIAVHGVGAHEPRSSASAIAHLLLRLPRSYGSRYTSFSETPLNIPTAPVPEAADAGAEAGRRGRKERQFWQFDERAGTRTAAEDSAGIGVMRALLANYRPKPGETTYETVRFDGSHLSKTGTAGDQAPPDARVHVYEMFWSDISRIGGGFLNIFAAFYQVVIHLPYVGLATLEESCKVAARNTRLWEGWLSSYRWALRSLTLAAPTLNIMMLAVGAGLLTRLIPESWRVPVATAVPALAVLVFATVLMYRLRATRSFMDVFVPLLAGGATYWIGAAISLPVPVELILVLEWWAITAIPLTAVFLVFDRNRPGALALAIGLFLLSTLSIVAGAIATPSDTTRILLYTLEGLNVLLLATWLTFTIATIVVTVLGLIIPRLESATKPEHRAPALRAAYTARFALALPAVAFAIMTLTIWGALIAGQSARVYKNDGVYSPLFAYPALPAHQRADSTRIVRKARTDSATMARVGKVDSARQVMASADTAVAEMKRPAYFLRMFGGSSDSLSGLVCALLILIAVFLVVWALIPVLIAEFRSPPTDRTVDRNEFITSSKLLGTWLSTAFRAARVSGEIVVFATAISIAGVVFAAPTLFWTLPAWLQRVVSNAGAINFGYTQIGALVISGASAVGLVALLTRLSKAGSGLRPALGIMADVDNYLRELPADRAPRARLAERYTSLLRYVCRWRLNSDAKSVGYDAVIIVAHSQGTIITADLLRYLDHEMKRAGQFEPRLTRLTGAAPSLPIIFMSMGCPLRQIYAQRFPDVYSWVTGPSQTADATAESSHWPDARGLLGVTAWINLYRSGDYVGRSVWRATDTKTALYDPTAPWMDAKNGRAEACIGAGAHTHYWDESADAVARALDTVIRETVASSSPTTVIDRAISAAMPSSAV
jgi:hypothetical protein